MQDKIRPPEETPKNSNQELLLKSIERFLSAGEVPQAIKDSLLANSVVKDVLSGAAK